MPIYQYLCDHCKQPLEIIRTMDLSDDLPSDEEEQGLPLCTDACIKHKWTKHILTTPSVIKGWNWGGGKGNW